MAAGLKQKLARAIEGLKKQQAEKKMLVRLASCGSHAPAAGVAVTQLPVPTMIAGAA